MRGRSGGRIPRRASARCPLRDEESIERDDGRTEYTGAWAGRDETVDYTERRDRDWNVDYDAGDRIIAYESLNVRRLGVRLDDLEHRAELAHLIPGRRLRGAGLGANLQTAAS